MASTGDTGPGSQKSSASRIPVSMRRYSYASDSGHSSPSSRAASKLGKHPANRSTPKPLQRTEKDSRSVRRPQVSQTRSVQNTDTARQPFQRSNGPKKNLQTPLQVKSPGRRDLGALAHQAEKSPSLRANIIAPPPKISPPLRSSRPRLPVSTASTSASRAKMVEKFGSSHAQNNDLRSSGRRVQRPPELYDIDLAARRQRITQAFNDTVRNNERKIRSDEDEQRKPAIESPAGRDTGRDTSVAAGSPQIDLTPTVIVNEPDYEDERDRDVFTTPTGERPFNDPTLRNEAGVLPEVHLDSERSDGDSPTLGAAKDLYLGTSPAVQPFLQKHEVGLPLAVTADEAEAGAGASESHVQAEPIISNSPNHTVLSQVMRMRNSSPITPQSLTRSESADDDDSERTDLESIQIMLRNTAYFDQEDPQNDNHEVKLPTGAIFERIDRSEHDSGSWTSSMPDRLSFDGRAESETEARHENRSQKPGSPFQISKPNAGSGLASDVQSTKFDSPEMDWSTMEAEALKVVDMVLRERSDLGVTDPDMLDIIYRKVLTLSPQLFSERGWDTERLESFCIDEIERSEHEENPTLQESLQAIDVPTNDHANELPSVSTVEHQEQDNGRSSRERSGQTTNEPVSRSMDRAKHRYNASLSSADDWASTSPSVGDWMHFAASDSPVKERNELVPPLPPKDVLPRAHRDGDYIQEPAKDQQVKNEPNDGRLGLGLHHFQHPPGSAPTRSPPPRPPSHSPPPPPPLATRSIDTTAAQTSSPSIYGSQPPSSVFSSNTFSPHVPRRITSLTNIANKKESPYAAMGKPPSSSISIPEQRPSLDEYSLHLSSKRSSPTPEQRRLRKRRHVIKELIDTEASFGRDIMVIVDIYKGTSSSCLDLSGEDVKILFGNSDQIVRFSTTFLDALKQAARSVYVMPKSERFQSKREGHQGNRITHDKAEAPNIPDDESSLHGMQMTDFEADRETFVGEAFKMHMSEMEQVYADYLKNHDAANKKLQSLQQNPNVEIWLKECKRWASDLTAAWNLDSLLVKPVQRILKYPLLLHQLIESTPPDHPDRNSLADALRDLTEISVRINETKKHVELVEQVLNRKRKESDVRTGLSKAFGRRTEKLKQHVGISEIVEDHGYNALKDRYGENFGQLVVVSRDVRTYKASLTKWVERLCELAAAADGWIDVAPTPSMEQESKLRHFAMTIREMASIALPEHLASIQKSVLDPMMGGAKMLETLQKDPKGLLQKRDKKLIDYARFKNMKDRGERLDKKTVERMEQWEALNREAKERMTKLLSLTNKLVESCLHNLVQIHLAWLDIWKRKLPSTMEVDLAELPQIEKDWQQDFDYQEASALSMSICNGSLLAEAVNMVSFLTPSTTLNGDDSPRQSSWNSGNKRSISINSESSPALVTDFTKRHSGSFTSSPMFDGTADIGMPPFGNSRLRAASFASGRIPGTPDFTARAASVSAQGSGSSMARPSTSTGRNSESSQQVPRLSLDGPSPPVGLPNSDQFFVRPDSGSTFFSGTAGLNHALPSPAGRGSAIFSSAMPMSDSPRNFDPSLDPATNRDYEVLFPVASVYEFNIDRARREAGFPYLTYVAGEIFDVIGERGELWLARNQDDPDQQIGWIWNKHFAKLNG